MEYFVKLNKTIETVSGELESIRLTLSVAEVSGVSAAIFVQRYFPKSPYSGSEEYEFYNVAYPDELTNISDRLTNPRNACYIRTTKVVKIFKCLSDMDEFMATVIDDLSRLLRHLKTFDIVSDSSNSQILVTGDGHSESIVEQALPSSVLKSKPAIVASKESELNDIKTETIIVDITGK